MKTLKLTLPVCLAILLFSCNRTEQVDQAAEAEKLMNVSREWAIAALQGDDLEKILNYWAEDAIVMPPDKASIKGHDELRKMLHDAFNMPGFEVNWEPQNAYVSKSGDLGYTIFHNYFSFLDSLGNTVTIYGKGVEIWKRQEDGSWKNVVDIHNSDPTITSIR